VKRYSYGERDYAFGQLILTLRTTIGLTQAGLAEPLGVSRRAVAEWEGGLSYPKAERLKLLIELGVRASAFATGHEDERWLQDLLAPAVPIQRFPQAEAPVAHAGAEPAAFPRIDWVGALDVSHFAGREVEVAELSAWIVQERCRLVTLVGMGGIGITPFRSWIRAFPTEQQLEFDIDLYYTVRREDEALFLDEIRTAATQHPSFRPHMIYSQRDGSLTMEHIVETSGGGTIVAKDVYMCGPSGMTESFQHSLRKLGVPPIHIHFEHFTFR
jgi:transcriptional regulator with XRE-family HTH domain